MGWIGGGLAGLAAVGVGAFAARRMIGGGVRAHPGQSLEGTRSLGDLIAAAGPATTHILFVPGMRVDGPGASAAFRAGLLRRVRGLKPEPWSAATGRRRLDLGPNPGLTYMGEAVWPDAAAWAGAQPFVDRWIFRHEAGGPIVVDEVNWWPLLFGPKGRFLLLPEAQLSGADAADLRLCARSDPPYYPFITPAQAQAAIAQHPAGSGGALANRALKAMLVNWGIADAVMSVGPMLNLVRATMDGAFAWAAAHEEAAGGPPTYVVVAESLGSFAVLEAFESGAAPAVRRVLESTFDLYFFANQIRLLELTRLKAAAAGPEGTHPRAPASAMRGLHRWAASSRTPEGEGAAARPEPVAPGPRQVIAFNDPSDAFTFEVPPIPGANVVNLYDRNGFDLLGLVADPVAAHTGHSRNRGVLRVLFERRGGPGGRGRASRASPTASS